MALTSERSQLSQAEVFTQTGCHELMDPRGVDKRESRDSEAHPNSLSVIFALDVSGSMGEIPAYLATTTLPSFMKAMLDAGVTDPQVMFMGIGYGGKGGDWAPLQVGQFESTEKLMDQWLTRLFLEGMGGGGNESYELAMYFAARHTDIDCLNKRGRRGYLFITGDEPPNPVVSKSQVGRIIGDDLDKDIPIKDIIEETQRSYEPFYLIPDPRRGRKVGRDWKDVLGDRVIIMETPDDTSHVCAGLVSLLEGAAPSIPALVERFQAAGLDKETSGRIAKVLTPFAASLDRDGTPAPDLGDGKLPQGDGDSGLDR
jgi:hypothetical protein